MDTLAVQLMVPTTKPIADFHRLVTAHAGQTRKRSINRAVYASSWHILLTANFTGAAQNFHDEAFRLRA